MKTIFQAGVTTFGSREKKHRMGEIAAYDAVSPRGQKGQVGCPGAEIQDPSGLPQLLVE
jgi:hypothetical protein